MENHNKKELCDCADGFTDGDVEELQIKFDIFGGCLRRLRDTCAMITPFLPIVRDHMNWFFNNIVSTIDEAPLLIKYASLVDNAERVIAAELLELTSVGIGIPDNIMFG